LFFWPQLILPASTEREEQRLGKSLGGIGKKLIDFSLDPLYQRSVIDLFANATFYKVLYGDHSEVVWSCHPWNFRGCCVSSGDKRPDDQCQLGAGPKRHLERHYE
jgi:hypothetical protein